MGALLVWLAAALDPLFHATGLAAAGIDPHAIAGNLIFVVAEVERTLIHVLRLKNGA